jgi:hypothetical protein
MTQDLKVRITGLGMLAGGLVLAWFFMLVPLQQARAGVPEVSLQLKAAFAAVPILVVLGIASLVGGEAFHEATGPRDPTRPRMPPLMWLLIVLMLALGGVCWWYVESQLAALGYS